MRLLIADTFTAALHKLTVVEQAQVKQAAFDFQLNPAQPGFSFHRLERTRDTRFWSARINRDLRLIVHRDGDSLLLCYVAHHDEAYHWAERRRMEVHPKTGAAQLIEVEERVEEIIRQVVREAEPALFARYDPDYLLALGVPPEWLAAVRHATETTFEKLWALLPQEAVERLLELACGNPVPIPAAVVTTDPYSHPDAQRRFRVMDSSDALHQALDYPWERWLVFLHPSQQAVVERRYNGPARVAGSAGTGKTVAALHRAAELARRYPHNRILLTTFSRTLALRLDHQANLLLGADSPERARITVNHLHRLARELWGQALRRTPRIATPGQINTCLAPVVGQLSDFSAAFVQAEWEQVVEAWGLERWEDYRDVSRSGRGTPLGARQRRRLWSAFEQVRAGLKSQGLLTWNQLCCQSAALLKQGLLPLFHHVIVDESQDFGPAELQLLRALVPVGSDDLFLCGDAGQRIYKAQLPWTAVGIDVRGRASRLRVNYRTTEQIRRFADRLLPGTVTEVGDNFGETEQRDAVSLLSGPAPQVRIGATPAEEIAQVAAYLRQRLAEGCTCREIAVFARTDEVLRQRVLPALTQAGLSAQRLDDETPIADDKVAIGTLHRAKGLEFKIVVVMGCDAHLLPLAAVLEQLADAADREEFQDRERHLLYVACTRAREQLLITAGGRSSVFLAG